MVTSYRRMLRCVRMRSRFTPSQDGVGPESRVSLAYDSIGDWLRGPESTSVFRGRIFIPFVRKTSRMEREEFPRTPPTQVQEDAKWLRMRMARRATSSPPDTNVEVGMGLPRQQSSSSRMDTRSKEIVLEAHKYATDNELTPKDIYATKLGKPPRPTVNQGVTCRRDDGDTRSTKMDVLGAATVDFPIHHAQDSGPTAAWEADLEV